MIIKFSVSGMTCAACSARVEKVAGGVPGVKKAEVNLLAGTMKVEADSSDCVDKIIKAVEAAGYRAAIPGKAAPAKTGGNEQLNRMKKRLIISGAFLLVLMYFTMGGMLGLPIPGWYAGTENALTAALLQFFLTLPVVFLNRSYYERGFKALWNRGPNMDSLIAVGSGAALLYGVISLFTMSYALGNGQWETVKAARENLYFESAAMILTLITLGKFFETRAKGRTGDAVRQLMDLSPKTALVRRDGAETSVPVEDVIPGDTVIVTSGAAIPVDGAVIKGQAAIDQSALTGESVPADVNVGSKVSAGTVCREGYIELCAEKVGEDTTLSQIIALVEEAGGSKAPIARLADKIAGIFVPVVMGISLVTFVCWMAFGQSMEFALTSAIAVLVISCPCALGLATPVAIMVGTGRGAGMGVLFKNAESLENLHRVDTVVLDKTGTLTAGKPSVTDVIPAEADRNTLLKIAAALEARSEHPFGKAIMEYTQGIAYEEPEDFEVLPGSGVSAVIGGKQYFGGNRRLMEELGVSVPDSTQFTKEGKTPLYFASKEGLFLGTVAAADTLKSDAKAAAEGLQSLGLEVIMLTGDNAATARAVADAAGVKSVIAEVLPGDKANTVAALQKQKKNVLMVGDGINDAPALVTADVGMAMGGGTDIAMESADIVLISHRLSVIYDAISLSKATMRNIRQNLFWAFFYNCLGIPVAAGVLYPVFQLQLSPMLGAALMSLSSVFVVSNALRLRFFKGKRMEENYQSESCGSYCTINTMEENTMETVIKVNGMMCPHCKARVESVCKEIAGTVDAVVDLQKKQVTVAGTPDITAVKNAIAAAGYEVVE